VKKTSKIQGPAALAIPPAERSPESRVDRAVDASVLTFRGEDWELRNADCIEQLGTLADNSIDLSVYSPPFMSLYTYSASVRDLGNCASDEEFFEHYKFCIEEIFRVTKPGRHTCVHVAEVTSTFATHGVIGLIDFPGKVIAAYQAAGWTYHGRVTIDKDPQAQAIRTHSKGLLFVQMRKDSTWSRPALADTILIFRKPGDNAVPVTHDTPDSSLTNDEWIEWARPIWYGIRESDTLNVAVARADEDERHICPLQLGTIERCIRLWSNPGELVLSPFAGIGSEGYEAVRLNRKFIGFELKPEYAAVAARNLRTASEKKTQGSLFAAEATA
jgi:DNA modification methylase